MGRPPANEARDTRVEIINAALSLFAEKGFFGTSMREIARAVGVRESAIYHHFVNKEELLNTLMNEAGEERAQRLDEALENWGDRSLRELLTHVADGMMVAWRQPRDQKLYRLLTTEGVRLAETGKVQLDISFRKVRARMDQLFADLAARGHICSIAPSLASLEFIAALIMIRNMTAQPRVHALVEGASPESLVTAHIEFLCRALSPPTPPLS